MHSFTQEDLVQYLYNESSPEKSALIKAASETDWNLREELETLTIAVKGLEKVNLSPRKVAVDNILKYAEKSVSALSTEI